LSVIKIIKAARKTGEVIMGKADEDAIREIELRFNEAWGRHEG